jgi:hypothetical protein
MGFLFSMGFYDTCGGLGETLKTDNPISPISNDLPDQALYFQSKDIYPGSRRRLGS